MNAVAHAFERNVVVTKTAVAGEYDTIIGGSYKADCEVESGSMTLTPSLTSVHLSKSLNNASKDSSQVLRSTV